MDELENHWRFFSSDFRNQAIFSTFPYTTTETARLFQEGNYIQVNTVNNPNGATRGQLIPIDAYPDVDLTARLEGIQVVPPITNQPYRGCVIFDFDCNTFVLNYLVVHNLPNPTSGYGYGGAAGTIGLPLFNLSRLQSPIYGSTRLNRQQQYLFFSQNFYVQINSASSSIRGQANTDYPYWAYLTGTYNMPPRSTASVGCAVFKFPADAADPSDLAYSIHHTVPDPIYVNLMKGSVGQAGQLVRHFRRAVSPIIGLSAILDNSTEYRFLTGKTYIEVTSARYPNGELRGQILRINPCIVHTPPQVESYITEYQRPIYRPQQYGNVNNKNNNNAAYSLSSSSLVFLIVIVISILFM